MPGTSRVALLIALAVSAAAAAALTEAPSRGAGGGAESRSQEKREARDAMRAGEFDAPTPGWREGPVRYLLSHDEDVAYRRLETQEARAAFIERFWASRDPDTSTPDNEFRDLFFRRVAFAVRAFTTESTKPGWKTDRGKIYILLGPPDDFDERQSQREDTQALIWTYRDPPPGTIASPNTQITFLRDPSGEYRLTAGVRLFSNESAMTLALAMQALQVKSPPELRPNADGTIRTAAPDQIGPTTAPGAGPAATLTGAASAPAPSRQGNLPQSADGTRAHADLFRTGDRRDLLVLTVWVKEDRRNETAEPPGVVARLSGEGAHAKTYALEGATALRSGTGDLGRGPEGMRAYQGGVVVDPGTYVVDYAEAAPGQASRPLLSDVVVVPPPAPNGLVLGPIALAAHFERLAESTAPEYSAPFRLGRLRIVPRIDNMLSPGEDLSFYYQVEGAATDPIEGRPDLDLEYRLFRLPPEGGDQGSGQPFGRPIHITGEQNLLQGFSLGTEGWSPGAYRLQVVVTDNLSGLSATGTTDFRLR